MFAFIIFIGALIFFYKFSIDLTSSGQSAAADLITNGKDVSNLLMKSGYPPNWNLSSVILFGLTDDEHLNVTKVYFFSQQEYNASKGLLSTQYNYYIFFEYANGTQAMVGNVSGIGKPGVNSSNILQVENPKNIIKIDRLVIYNVSIVKMKVYIW